MQSVNQFVAESNLMCNLCQEMLYMKQEGDIAGLSSLLNEFPQLNVHYNFYESFQVPLRQLHESDQQLCKYLGLCETSNAFNKELQLNNHVELVNRLQGTWQAGMNSKFINLNVDKVKQLLGTVVDQRWLVEIPSKYTYVIDQLPISFNAIDKWPECKTLLLTVNDQSNCGSCWSFSVGEAFSERQCIHSQGVIQTPMSESDILGCCYGLQCMSYGCNGGQLGTAWKWLTTQGVVTGGKYEENQYCYSYTMPSCNHHSSLSPERSCDTVTTVEPQCYNTCQTNQSINYKENKRKAATHYKLNGVDAIKADLIQYGPVSAGFTVYEDFLTYKSGVYQHLTGEALGGHGIDILGYGIENDVEYWLCKNSWNTDFGLQGFFKIKIGDSGINDSVYAGTF